MVAIHECKVGDYVSAERRDGRGVVKGVLMNINSTNTFGVQDAKGTYLCKGEVRVLADSEINPDTLAFFQKIKAATRTQA